MSPVESWDGNGKRPPKLWESDQFLPSIKNGLQYTSYKTRTLTKIFITLLFLLLQFRFFFPEPTLSIAKPTTTTSGEIYRLYPLYASVDVSYWGRYGDDLVGLLWPGIVHCQDSKGIPLFPLLSRQTGCAVPTSIIIQLTWRQLLY